MKVKIGPYIYRKGCNIHSRYMEKKYGYDYGENQTKFEHFLEKTEDIVQSIYNYTINQYLDRKKRKIKIKIDNYDIWGMHETLAYIILPMLKKLKEQKQGAPYVDIRDVPVNLRPKEKPSEENGYVDETHFQRWNYVLDEMIFAFESQFDDWEDQFYSGNIDTYFEKNDDGTSTMKDGPNHTFKVQRKEMDAYQKRISKGFKLFGKYYENLWD